MRKVTKRLAMVITSATVGVLAVSIALPAAAAERSIGPSDMVPRLADLQVSSDVLPPEIDLSLIGDVDPASTRLLGHEGAATYWVGMNDNSSLCLISALEGGNGVYASSCSTLDQFYKQGSALRLEDGSTSESGEAYLLPDDVDSSAITEGAAQRLTASADQGDVSGIVVDPDVNVVLPGASGFSSGEEWELPRSGNVSSSFTFRPLQYEMR